jgi:hypothetical protein
VNDEAGTVSILLGNGDGTFLLASTNAAGDLLQSVVIGDLNGDGKPGLAVADRSLNNVAVLLGNGDDTFLPAITFAVGNGPRSVALGDLNGDGKPDVATANTSSDDVSILLNGTTPLQVPVDIKLQSCPNPLNVRSAGRLPVAILGTADFDVTTVDPASIRLLDVVPLRSAFEDVATPFLPFVGKECIGMHGRRR